MRVLETRPDDEIIQLKDVTPGLDYYYEFVGGDGTGPIEHITLIRGEDARENVGMYIHDEGRIMDPPMPRNQIASELYWHSRGLPADHPYDIRGPAVIVGGPDDEGDDMDVPQRFIDWMVNVGYAIVQVTS